MNLNWLNMVCIDILALLHSLILTADSVTHHGIKSMCNELHPHKTGSPHEPTGYAHTQNRRDDPTDILPQMSNCTNCTYIIDSVMTVAIYTKSQDLQEIDFEKLRRCFAVNIY